jgi:hypothetical protein
VIAALYARKSNEEKDMKAKVSATATLADVKLVLLAPTHIQTKRSGYGKAQVDFASARLKFIDRATSTTWADTVKAARQAGPRGA